MKKMIVYVLAGCLFSTGVLCQEGSGKAKPTLTSVADDLSAEPATPIGKGARYACTKNGSVRRIEIEYETVNALLPCRVNYYKDQETPGEITTLWRAETSKGFCESKAVGFVEKLQSLGWDCSER